MVLSSNNPGEREKLDGFSLFNSGTPQDTNNAAAAADTAFNIRKSLAWDSAFFTSPGVLEPEELLQVQAMNLRNTGNAINLLGHEEEILLPSQSLEPERTRKIDSFRKSLAWDNAFFTSQGVLDPEELSIVNSGFKKCEAHQRPENQQVWRSAELISTIDSGCSSLMSSLEFEIFEENRSSVQKSTSLSGVKMASLKLKRVRASKKPDASSRMRMKAMPASQRQILNVYRPERILKEASVSSQKLLAAGSGKFNSSASLRPPKISIRVNQPSTAAAKRVHLGGNSVKMGTENPKCNSNYGSYGLTTGQPMTLSKKPCLGASRSGTTTHESAVFCSLSKGFCNASEDTAGKSPVNSRTKIDSSLLSSVSKGFTIGTPLRSKKTKKDEPEALFFTPKSCYKSPASSLDCWSSLSSSSTSVYQRSKASVVSLDTLSRQASFERDGVSQASDLEKHSHEESFIGHENQEAKTLGSVSKHVKPSGLRIPSPKIGFFDEENALIRSSGDMQLHSGNGNRNGAANLNGRLQSPRTLSQKTRSPCPTFGVSPLNPSNMNEPGLKRAVNSYVGLTSEVENDLPSKSESKVRERFVKRRVKNQESKENEEPKMHCPRNYLSTLHSDDKENAYCFNDQIDCLSKHVGAIHLGL